jgi:hypothetical protein
MIKYSDLYVTTLARGLCQGNEQFVAASVGSHQSFWTFKIPWFRHDYLFIATSERLIVVDHRKGLLFDRMDRVDSYRWSEISSIKIPGFFGKLVVKDQSNRTLVRASRPRLAPMRDASTGMRAMVQTWEQRRQLAAAPAYGQLPPQFQAPQHQTYAQQPQA